MLLNRSTTEDRTSIAQTFGNRRIVHGASGLDLRLNKQNVEVSIDTTTSSQRRPMIRTSTPAKCSPPRYRNPAPKVFICHSSIDERLACSIVAIFEKAGIRCWIAPRDIPPGTQFDIKIVDALETCTDMILLHSDHARKSTHVQREIRIWSETNKRLLHVRLDNSPLSKQMRYYLTGHQWTKTANPVNLLKIFQNQSST
ncbi:MAG: hypothetical protein ACI89J_002780 [Hyphomicrobiaceae bacterium]|jgi:hypothetical protein